jgi:hypothetical protein
MTLMVFAAIGAVIAWRLHTWMRAPASTRPAQPAPPACTPFQATHIVAGRDPRRAATPEERAIVLERDGHRCRYCGAGGPGATLHVDHVVAWSHGGPSDLSNFVTLCDDCNNRKSAKSDHVARAEYQQRSGFVPLDQHPGEFR